MKQRLDIVLVERGLATSRNQAAALIMAGDVRSDDRVLDKPGTQVDADIELTLKQRPQYVSRGGDKLASVAETLGLDFTGKVVLDVGSSTGGFSDYALQHGATHVYCIDVGTGQLDQRLRTDGRVTVMERTDIRDVTSLPESVDIAVIDVSFVSLTKILESVAALIQPGGSIVAMAKPQFEAGKSLADRYKGVITDEVVRQGIIGKLRVWLEDQFNILGESDSAVHGPKGNIEHFFLLQSKR
jgi:23S rRNA (cytidine1920-2'-O)/16S rRNA (cytidine1409-2'-O)-methyltransferase